jgi:nitrogen fixation protein FixH
MLSQRKKDFLHNPWALGITASILFGGIGVSMALVYVAVHNRPALVDREYYESGRKYERTVIQQLAARDALAWRTNVLLPEPIVVGTPGLVRLIVQDKNDAAVTHGKVSLTAYRPSDANADFTIQLDEGSAGEYAGSIRFPLKGIWELTFRIERGDDVFDVTRKIQVAG